MAYSNPRTQRLYARLHAQVKNAKTAYDKAVAMRRFRKRFPPQMRLSPEARAIAKRAKVRIWHLRNPQKVKTIRQRRYQRLKAAIIYHYTKGTMRCMWPAGCKQLDIDDLELDHVDGDWSKDVLPNGNRMGGNVLYNKLMKEGLPEGYQILCSNHNREKGPPSYFYRKQGRSGPGLAEEMLVGA